MKTNNAIDDLRYRAAIYKQAADYIAENFDDDEEVDIDEIVRDIQRDNERRVAELEERQHQSGFYAFQDLMDMYRRER